ncbi:MAG: 2-hydroxyacid dehydrogenase [Sedimentitalea sp.]
MALLIDIGLKGWMADADLRDRVAELLPGSDIRLRETLGDPDDITMLAVSSLAPDLPPQLRNLKLVQKLGAGVETIVANPALPDHIRVTRLKPDAPAREIAEYCLAYILRHQRNMTAHDTAQTNRHWDPIAPREAPKTTVGVLGLGHIGTRTAQMIKTLDFNVEGWSRTPKTLPDIPCHHGPDALPKLLARCDYVAAILPSTQATRGLFDAQMLSQMKPGAMLINAGRGDLIDEPALINALQNGSLGHAVLDVVSQEPLPRDNPLWQAPNLTLTPHVSGWHLGDALKDVAENYRRISSDLPLLHEVDRKLGY